MSTIARASTAAVPSSPAFNRLAWSNLAAQSAEQIGLAAAPLVAVLALGAGAGETGLLQTAQTLPFLLLSIPAGVLADRLPRRTLMASAEAVRVASLVAILALVAGHALTLPLLAVLGALGAAGTVTYSVAAPSLVPALVPRDALAAANGRMELARSAAFAAGPAVGGALVGWTGPVVAFAVAAGLSTWAVVALRGIDEPARSDRPRRHVAHDLREGAALVFGHRLLRPVLLTALVFNVSLFLLNAVYVPYAVHHLGLAPMAIGFTLAAYGVGMLAGALAAMPIARAVRFGTMISLGPVTGFVASLVMAATIWVPSPWLAGLSFFLIGAGPMLWVISTTTLRQAVTPGHALGRVSAIMITAMHGARPIGSALGALVGATYGAETCLVVAAIGFAVQAAVILASPVRSLARQPDVVG